MDLGQFEGSDFISDVCQLASLEHFFYGMKSKMAAKDMIFLAEKLADIFWCRKTAEAHIALLITYTDF